MEKQADPASAEPPPVVVVVDDKDRVTNDHVSDDIQLDYPSLPRLALLTVGIALVIFVIALDNTIIATAIPTITTVFDSLDDVGWYGSAYLLATTSLQPSFGKLYTIFDVKWTYLSAIIIFEVGSIVCAAATSSSMLIVGRAIAGAGASGLFSGGLTIIGFSVPVRKIPIYIAILSSMYGIAAVVGPILGGVLTDHASWRWCFWINLPFGGAAFLAVLVFFKSPKRDRERLSIWEKIKRVDILGAVLLTCGVVCLLLALQWGGTTKPWNSSRIWGLLIGFVLIIVVFGIVQWRRGDEATIPPRILLKQRTVCTCAIYAFLMNMGLYTHVYFLPFYFQAVKGASAESSGIRSIPYLVSMSVATIVVGGIVTKTGYYVPFLWTGAAIFSIGSGLLFTLHVTTSSGEWIGFQIITGIGVGISTQMPFLAIQAVLSKQDMPSGNAIIMFFITLGGSIAISIAQTIFSNSLVHEIPKHTTGVDVSAIISGGATALRQIVPPDQLLGVLKAYTFALDRVFIVPIAVAVSGFLISLLAEWRTLEGAESTMVGA